MNYEYINPLIQFGYEQYDLVIKISRRLYSMAHRLTARLRSSRPRSVLSLLEVRRYTGFGTDHTAHRQRHPSFHP